MNQSEHNRRVIVLDYASGEVTIVSLDGESLELEDSVFAWCNKSGVRTQDIYWMEFKSEIVIENSLARNRFKIVIPH